MFDAAYWGVEYFGVEYWPPVLGDEPPVVIEPDAPSTGGDSNKGKGWRQPITRREAQILQEDRELISLVTAFLIEINQ